MYQITPTVLTHLKKTVTLQTKMAKQLFSVLVQKYTNDAFLYESTYV